MISKNASLRRIPEYPVISLISRDETLHEEVLSVLEHQYRVQWMAFHEVLYLPDQGEEGAFTGTAAILIGWHAEDPAVLLRLRTIARQQSIPLIALCPSFQADRVAALVLGADYVLTWPFGADLLRAYSVAYRRLSTPPDIRGSGDGTYQQGIPDYHINAANSHDISRAGLLCMNHTARLCEADGTVLNLTPREFDVLALLVRQPGTCFTRDQMLREVWGLHFDPETNILDVQIYNLRRKLRPFSLATLIETVRGVGYRLATPARKKNL